MTAQAPNTKLTIIGHSFSHNCVSMALSILPLTEATRLVPKDLQQWKQDKTWWMASTSHVPIFIGLAYSLKPCKAVLTEAWGCLYYSGCCCKGTSQDSNLPGEEQQGYHARKQNPGFKVPSEPQNCWNAETSVIQPLGSSSTWACCIRHPRYLCSVSIKDFCFSQKYLLSGTPSSAIPPLPAEMKVSASVSQHHSHW